MARKDPGVATKRLDKAQRKLAGKVLKAVESFDSLTDDKAVLFAERKARLLATLGRAVTNIRRGGPLPDRDPPPPANQNLPTDEADDADSDGDLLDLADPDARVEVAASLERLARQFPDYGLAVFAGSERPEPDAVLVASSGRRRSAA